MNPRSFFAELKRRNVYKVAVAYAVVTWLLIQAASIILPTFEAPAWTMKVLIAALAVGFPLAALLAWAFEMTPQGMKRTENVGPNEFIPQWSGRKFAGLIVTVAVVAAGLLLFQLFRTKSAPPAAITAAPRVPEKSIAVLPFENLSDNKENAYFADGIQDDVLGSLAKIKELKVISRSSVMGYRDAAKRNLLEIGQQLGVAHILEGSVRRSLDRVLVNVNLIDTRNDRQVWAERYDRTLADSLTLQGELATEIASALRATLSPEEKARVETKPTDNPDAYLLYLRARESQTTTAGLLGDYLRAAQLYSEAIKRDAGFALARARLSATLSFVYQQFQPTAANRERARAEAEEALRLRPSLGEGHLARALCLYWLDKNYDAALQELAVAARLLPNDSDVDSTVAYITRRRGHWSEALEGLRRVLARDPRNGQIAEEIALTDFHLRDWPAAIRSGDRAVALAPDSPSVVIYRRYVNFWSGGDLGPLHAALATFPAGADPDGVVTYACWDAGLIERDFAAAERAVADCALDQLPFFFGAPLPKPYLLGCIAKARGDEPRAREFFDAARLSFESEVQASPQDAYRHAQLGLLYAYIGRRDEAIREGRRGVELRPESRDALDGPLASSFLALILARCGQTDEAVALIEHLLQTPASTDLFEASMTLPDLRLRWEWDPLRADPRFQKLLAGPEPKTIYQ
jgi:TolB-like protein